MPANTFEFTEFLISKDDGRSTIQLFTASPTPLEEQNLGRIFAIMELDSVDSTNAEILQAIITDIHAEYYASESFAIDGAFEHALQKGNATVQELIAEIGEDWLKELNMVVGVQMDTKLIFAHIGRCTALMIVKDQVIDILDSTQAKLQAINPVKLFNNVISGGLTPDATVLFATETILDYLSREKIKRIVAQQEPDKAVLELDALLSDNTGTTNFGALIVKQSALAAKVERAKAVSGLATEGSEQPSGRSGQAPVVNPAGEGVVSLNRDSMNALVDKERETSDLLTSSLWPQLKKAVTDRVRGNGDEEESTGSMAGTVLKGAGVGLLRLATGTKSVVSQGVSTVRELRGSNEPSSVRRRNASSLGGRLSSGSRMNSSRSTASTQSGRRNLSEVLSGWLSAAVQWFSGLSRMRQLFFVVAVVVLLIFAQGVVRRGESNITTEEEQNFSQVLSEVDVKINEGKAAIIFNDGSARELFLEARSILDQVPTDSAAYQERGAELAAVIDQELQESNRVNDLGELSPVLSYASISPQIQVSEIVLLGASLYGFDSNNGSVYRGNLENNTTSVSVSDASAANRIVAAEKASPGTALVVKPDSSAGTFNPLSQSVEALALPVDALTPTLVDISVFGTRVYTLDSAEGTVFRHNREGDAYATGTSWVTDSTASLNGAVSFAIDGSIYVLMNTGEVQKFDGGVRDTGFALNTVDPALTSAQELFTDENSDRLYLLDQSNQRVLVFDKSGGLVNQYTSSSFTDIRDMVVDEANNAIYVLNNGSDILKIDL